MESHLASPAQAAEHHAAEIRGTTAAALDALREQSERGEQAVHGVAAELAATRLELTNERAQAAAIMAVALARETEVELLRASALVLEQQLSDSNQELASVREDRRRATRPPVPIAIARAVGP